MERVEDKISILQKSLVSLETSIDMFKSYEQYWTTSSPKSLEEVELALQGNMIQRFEYCADHLWKMLKVYLEEVVGMQVSANGPKAVIRDAVEARILSESEGEQLIKMINSRNQTSHIYRVEVADLIASQVPGYYSLMRTVVDRIQNSLL